MNLCFSNSTTQLVFILRITEFLMTRITGAALDGTSGTAVTWIIEASLEWIWQGNMWASWSWQEPVGNVGIRDYWGCVDRKLWYCSDQEKKFWKCNVCIKVFCISLPGWDRELWDQGRYERIPEKGTSVVPVTWTSLTSAGSGVAATDTFKVGFLQWPW